MSQLELNRRQLLKGSGKLLTLAALSKMSAEEKKQEKDFLIPAKAKRVIYITHPGGPSQIDLFDYKPQLEKWHGIELPDSIRQGQRLTTMTSEQGHLKIMASQYKFHQNKNNGQYFSELIPHINKASDEICFIKSMYTNEINHDPGLSYLTSGSNRFGKPGIGSWVSYALGSENKDLPPYVLMVSQTKATETINAILWDSGFLPSEHQGTQFYSSRDPVLFLKSPKNISPEQRKKQIDFIKKMNERRFLESGDPEILSRTAQYEMAHRMQSSLPEVTDLSKEPESVFEKYGPDSKKPGTFAYNCILARKLAEKDVRFIQLFHRNWDHHYYLDRNLPKQAKAIDQPSAALISDLKERGLLDDTLIVSASEFGRTSYCQGAFNTKQYGRDHHGRCFTIWMAGAGIKKGISYGETDDFSFNINSGRTSIESLNATILNLLGINHNKLDFYHQGLKHRLTGVENVDIIRNILL